MDEGSFALSLHETITLLSTSYCEEITSSWTPS